MSPIMSSTEHTDHKTGTAWLNELGVLSALASTKNEPLYVAEIARRGPPVRSLSNWELKRFNKPGIKAACMRLKKLGIVDSKPSMTPKKKGDTEHYFIRPSLKALSDIYLNYGSGILGVVREAEFGQAIIASDMANFLGSRLHASRGLDGIVDPSDLREIESMARDSTKALGMLLGNEIPFDLPVKNEESRQLPLMIRRIKEIMNLAFALDLMTRPAAQLAAEGWRAEVSLSTSYTRGGMNLVVRTNYDSDRLIGKQGES